MADNGIITINTEMVYMNLHRKALEFAAPAAGMAASGNTMNQFIVNTMYSDGAVIRDDPFPEAKFDVPGRTKNMEMGIVFNLKDAKSLFDQTVLDDKAKAEKQRDANRNAIASARTRALTAINAYFKVFTDADKSFDDKDLEVFVPDYAGGKVRSSIQGDNYSIVGLNDEETKMYMSIFDPDQSRHPSRDQVEKLMKRVGDSPRIGFKVKYSIT